MAGEIDDEIKDKSPPPQEPLTGSSKRKRKSTVKRNVDMSSDSNVDDSKVDTPIKTEEDKEDGSKIPKKEAELDGFSSNLEMRLYVDERADKKSLKFVCDFCKEYDVEIVFTTKLKLKKHIGLYHSPMNPPPKPVCMTYSCKLCDDNLYFPNKIRLTHHLNSKHPGFSEFTCEVCGASFKLKNNYRLHIKTHNIETKKKFTCNVCGAKFVNVKGYEAHKKRFPGNHSQKLCPDCGCLLSQVAKTHRCKKVLIEEAKLAKLAIETKEAESRISFQHIQQEHQQITAALDENPVAAVCEQVVLDEGEDQQQPVYYDTATVELYQERQLAPNDAEPTIILRECPNKSGQYYQAVPVSGMESLDESQLHVLQWNVLGPYVIKEENNETK